MWNKVFKSRFLKGLESQLIYYFYVLVRLSFQRAGSDETCEGRDTDPLLPGRYQGDAEVQQRGAAAAAEGDEPSRHPNADGKEEGGVRINITSHITAHATLPSSEELLHRRVRSLPLPGHQETRQPHLCQRRAAGTEMSSSSVLRLSFLGGTYTEVKLKLFYPFSFLHFHTKQIRLFCLHI